MITVPKLAKGKGWKGPEFYRCFNTGMAPAIFHSRTGKYVVGPELRCRDAMQQGITLQNKRVWGKGRQRVWLFKTRSPAVAKFVALAEAQEKQNEELRHQHTEASHKAVTGDLAAVLTLGDF